MQFLTNSQKEFYHRLFIVLMKVNYCIRNIIIEDVIFINVGSVKTAGHFSEKKSNQTDGKCCLFKGFPFFLFNQISTRSPSYKWDQYKWYIIR